MAKKSEKKQGSLFGDVASSDIAYKRPVALSDTKNFDNVEKPSIYGGLNIDQLTLKIEAVCLKNDAKYFSNIWDGTANIEVFFKNFDRVVSMLTEMNDLVLKYSFRVRSTIHHHASDEFGFRYKIVILVPAPIDPNLKM
jgi:hypothetical protein